jgi:hypothetical protein
MVAYCAFNELYTKKKKITPHYTFILNTLSSQSLYNIFLKKNIKKKNKNKIIKE